MKTTYSNLFSAVITLFVSAVSVSACAEKSSGWQTVYQDQYNYSQQTTNSKFNTWFWREDSAASHTFEDLSDSGCSKAQPCVKLTVHAYPANTEYSNAEMYNNSCVKNPTGGDQQLATLKETQWGIPLYAKISSLCDMPYPYQTDKNYLTPFNLSSSWGDSNTPAYLQANPLAFTSGDVEKPWKSFRDITFNNPFQATDADALSMTFDLKSTTKDQGGSRG